jgi:hypothetical protein
MDCIEQRDDLDIGSTAYFGISLGGRMAALRRRALVPRDYFIRESLGWLDRYLGPVAR